MKSRKTVRFLVYPTLSFFHDSRIGRYAVIKLLTYNETWLLQISLRYNFI
jgi:hypothetical protein